MRPHRWRFVVVIACLWFAGSPGCNQSDQHDMRRDINQVKEAHTEEIMSIPGVVGVYVGALEDGRPCIGVLVLELTDDITRRCPKELEGYPVKIEISGEIRPLR